MSDVPWNPASPAELLTWLDHVREYGGPTLPDGDEQAEPGLWSAIAVIGLVGLAREEPADLVPGVQNAALNSGRALLGLLRLTAAEAAPAALRYAIGEAGWDSPTRVMDAVALTDPW